MNKEQIKRARQANLAEYLLAQGEPLQQTGSRYRHCDHDSLVFTENAYYWNSRGEHGNAIDFLVRHRGMTFREAVLDLLTGQLIGAEKEQQPITNFSWDQIKIDADVRRTIAYLSKSRGIDPAIIQKLIKDRLLFQEVDKIGEIEVTNAIFPIYDNEKQIVGAEVQGILSGKRFKGIKNGSKYGYGFNVRCGEDPRYILFFESAIDLISFMETDQRTIAKMNGSRLVSLSGLKEPIFNHSLEAFGSGLQPVLCVDNDSAGNEFITRLRAKYEALRVYRPPQQFKDWNDLLKYRKGINEK